ncbi:hypothetical protein DSM112329_00465 [Paraconexibacter sp. AEG42_29]|uniref:Transposase n=1 Tax=Paraconexibacter sp. AEG42_29 TaxID=2997339 RepID=A0AAU7APT1_9ACTN
MPLPERDITAVRHHCEQRIPPEVADELRIEADVDARGITIVGCRPPWRKDHDPAWTRRGVARLRWTSKYETWTLYWPDRRCLRAFAEPKACPGSPL